MATSAKHFSRKELRQPDNFVLFTQRALSFVQQKRRLFVIAGALIMAVIIGISLWQVYKSRQNQEAWTAGEKYISVRIESFAKHSMQSLGSLPTDCFPKGYSIFVMYFAVALSGD